MSKPSIFDQGFTQGSRDVFKYVHFGDQINIEEPELQVSKILDFEFHSRWLAGYHYGTMNARRRHFTKVWQKAFEIEVDEILER